MAGWQDAPVVGEAPATGKAAWESAPVVEPAAPRAPITRANPVDLGQAPQSASRLDYLINSAKKGVGNFASLPGMILDAFRGLTRSQVFEELEKRGLIRPEGETEKGGWAGLSRSGWDQLLGAQRDMKAPDTATRYAGKVLELGVAGGPFSARTVMQAPNALRAARWGPA